LKIIPIYTTEKQLVEGVLAEHRTAQKTLYDRFSPKMYAICCRYFRDQSRAEDLLMEGFLKVFGKLHTFSFKGSFEGWMRKIFVRICLDELRKNNSFNFSDSGTLEIEAPDSVVLELPEAETRPSLEYLLHEVNSLPLNYSLVFSLYVLDGYSHQEISTELGISVAASKVQLSRARKTLQQRLESFKTSQHGKK